MGYRESTQPLKLERGCWKPPATTADSLHPAVPNRRGCWSR